MSRNVIKSRKDCEEKTKKVKRKYRALYKEDRKKEHEIRPFWYRFISKKVKF